MPETLPLVAIGANIRDINADGFHGVRQTVLTAVRRGARCLPVILPAMAAEDDLPSLLARVDGIVLTGGATNVDPALYGSNEILPETDYDRQRNLTSLAVIRHAAQEGIPLFAICLGMQELNVAFGGSLRRLPETHVALHRNTPLTQQAHDIVIAPAGKLFAILGQASAQVNSSHSWALDEIAPNLQVEARSDDGTVEAVSLQDSQGFAIGVEWHPEYNFDQDQVSTKLLEAFGQAARQRMRKRVQGIAPHA